MTADRTLYASSGERAAHSAPPSLVDLIDRVLGRGVVVQGHLTLSVANIDLVDLDIALLVAATATAASS